MSKEVLDILDTAVKIGLGAIIAGISTYLVTTKTYKLDVLKENKKNTFSLIKNISDSFESSNGETNQLGVTLNDFFDGDINSVIDAETRDKAIQLCLDSELKIQNARSNANLLGLKELFDALDQYTDIIMEMLKTISQLENTNEYQTKFNKFFDNGLELQKTIYELINKAYNEKNA